VADARHKRDTNARRRPAAITLAGSLAVAATLTAVGVGVAAHHPSAPSELIALDQAEGPVGNAPTAGSTRTPSAASPTSAPGVGTSDRGLRLSRSANRDELDDALTPTGVPADQRRTEWTTTDLNLWPTPTEQSATDGDIQTAQKLLYTGVSQNGRDEVIVDGDVHWVTHGYLTTTKPAGVGAGLSDQPCPDMSVENRLAADTILVYRSVCHAFPQVTDYLGWGPREEHDTGHAIDVMVYGDKALGDEIAAWVQAHASELHIYDILWYHRIWTPARASEGWRTFADRGSPTANHMDHEHIGTL
jgi:hypothetical protein